MAIEKSFQLYINDDNVKQYFTTSGGALNGAAIGGKYITMRTSSTTATFTMKDAGRDVLFPSAAAIAHKVDIWAQTIATLSSSKNTINVAIAGQNAIATERIRTSLTEHTGSVSGSFTKSNTSAVYVVKIANGFHAAGVRDTSITAYFTQYSCSAAAAGNGIKSVSVSNTSPYEGETVTFSAELYNGANFEGWFSDVNCTQLVSSSLTYSTTASADLTLYANATIEAAIYNCSAVAGENIVSASVSDESVVSGDSVTFTAQLNEGCLFDGWYSDSSYSTLVSTANPYTISITSDTTLYAKGTKISYSVSVGTAEHGTATVSANTAYYGDSMTFTFTPEDETWELYGWYSDEGLTQLVSESNPYTLTVTDNVMLYPKIGKIRYTITLTFRADNPSGIGKLAVVDFDSLTEEEIRFLKSGNYAAIDANKVYDTSSVTPTTSLLPISYTVSIRCPIGLYVAMSLQNYTSLETKYYRYIDGYTWWPYYWYQPNQDASFNGLYYTDSDMGACNCIAIAKDNISSVDATTPVVATKEAIFTAKVNTGCSFVGWYSDEACTQLVSNSNPAYVVTPQGAFIDEGETSRNETTLILYAKATMTAVGTGIYIKQNGSYVKATVVYKKIDGAWVQLSDSELIQLKSEMQSGNYRVVTSG